MRLYTRRSSSVVRQNQGIKQSRNRTTMRESSTDGEGATNLRNIGSFKKIDVRRRRNETIFPSNLTLAGSKFHRVGAAIEEARVPAFVSEKQFPILMACRLSVRYEETQHNAMPHITYQVDKHLMRMLWLMVSYAADRSSMVSAVTLSLSMLTLMA